MYSWLCAMSDRRSMSKWKGNIDLKRGVGFGEGLVYTETQMCTHKIKSWNRGSLSLRIHFAVLLSIYNLWFSLDRADKTIFLLSQVTWFCHMLFFSLFFWGFWVPYWFETVCGIFLVGVILISDVTYGIDWVLKTNPLSIYPFVFFSVELYQIILYVCVFCRSADEKVTVVFHVIISRHFKVDPQTDAVFMRCEPLVLGGFSPPTDKHKLKCLRYSSSSKIACICWCSWVIYTHTHATHTHPHARMHARTHAHTCTHTHACMCTHCKHMYACTNTTHTHTRTHVYTL